jgi:hypothetical protein
MAVDHNDSILPFRYLEVSQERDDIHIGEPEFLQKQIFIYFLFLMRLLALQKALFE